MKPEARRKLVQRLISKGSKAATEDQTEIGVLLRMAHGDTENEARVEELKWQR